MTCVYVWSGHTDIRSNPTVIKYCFQHIIFLQNEMSVGKRYILFVIGFDWFALKKNPVNISSSILFLSAYP